jgi:hypothetical protein
MKHTLAIAGTTGVLMRAVLLPEGSEYGRTGALIAESDMVEFYDSRFPHCDHGLFISRYYLHTLQAKPAGQGITLDGGVTDWQIDGATADYVTAWAGNPDGVGLPPHTLAQWDGATLLNPDDGPLWSGQGPLPALGAVVPVGKGMTVKVEGYRFAAGFVMLLWERSDGKWGDLAGPEIAWKLLARESA